MLKINRMKKYTIPKYPRFTYHRKRGHISHTIGKGSALASVIALLGSCGMGVCGPPPVAPEMVTENEGREIIKRVFSENGIVLGEDVPYYLTQGIPDSVALDLDGFNDSLSVGYEYVSEDDYGQFDNSIIGTLDSLINESGPYIKCVREVQKEDSNYESHIEEIIQEFVDYLKNQGVI